MIVKWFWYLIVVLCFYVRHMQPLTGLWGCGDIALIYRYGSPNGLLWNGNAFIYRYGSPNGLLRNGNAFIATDMEALTGFCGTGMPLLLQIWKP